MFLGFLSGLIACVEVKSSPADNITETPPQITLTNTPTIIWFPPTATFTPLPTATLSITPTLDTRPKFGDLIFTDDFSEPSFWSLGNMPVGNITLGVNEISLVVTEPRGYLFSLRQGPSLRDFYAEITTNPSICRSADEYGMIFLAASSQDFFRFGLSCEGKIRVDRILSSQATSPQPPEYNSAVPLGAPSISRIAVWVIGNEMKFYANGIFLFSMKDASIPAGGLGVFARSAGEDSMTINFSSLAVYEAYP